MRQPRQGEPTADRAGLALAGDVEAAFGRLLFAEARFLEVTRGQDTFVGTRRVYTASGETTKDVAVFVTGETVVPHGLGREPLGWFVVDRTANAQLFRVANPSVATDPTQYFVFRSSANAVFRVVAF